MSNIFLAGLVTAVAGYVYLVWIVFSARRARRWAASAEEERPGEELATEKETGFPTYSSDECYHYCEEHTYLGDADPWLSCKQVCRM
jgi:hypothetical protein